jgi:hypothetical protein
MWLEVVLSLLEEEFNTILLLYLSFQTKFSFETPHIAIPLFDRRTYTVQFLHDVVHYLKYISQSYSHKPAQRPLCESSFPSPFFDLIIFNMQDFIFLRHANRIHFVSQSSD